TATGYCSGLPGRDKLEERGVTSWEVRVCVQRRRELLNPGEAKMQVRPHDRFAVEVHLTPGMVSAYAHNIGDLNPVHHDSHYAATTRYQRPIASGAHTTGLLIDL